MIVLGIDPGIERTGYAFLSMEGSVIKPIAYGLISTRKEMPKIQRLKQIHEDLKTLMTRHPADVLSIESLIFAKNVTTAFVVSEARGVILMTAAEFGIDAQEYTPVQVKKALTGYGKADKVQIERAVCFVLGLSEPPKPDDVCDAIAVAVCGANHLSFHEKVRRSQGAGGFAGRLE